MATLAELLAAVTIQQSLAKVLGVYQSYGFPTTSWQSGGTDLTRALAIATAVNDLAANYVPGITAGGFTQLAADIEDTGWIRLLADQNFDLPFNPATFTVGTITLTASSTAGTNVIAAGQLIAVFGASGNRYINSTGGTLSASSTLDLQWTAEFAGAQYNDPSSSSITLVTPLPGVTLSNPATDYTDVVHVGSGTGTLDLTGSPVGSHQVIVRIDSTGAAGVAEWSYSLDGSPFVSESNATSVTNLGGTGINIDLVDGMTGTTSFVDGDTYLFNTPGSWITTQGSDAEVNIALALRCQDRWSSLSNIQTEGYYELITRSVPTVGSQVTQVIVLPDADINNKVNIVVAGPEGVLPPGTIADIQSYVTPRAIGTDYPTVVSPAVHDTTVAFTATVQASLLSAAQDAVDTVVTNYVNESGINPTIRLASIIELAMEQVGMIDVADLLIDGVAANLTLGDDETFVVASLDTLTIAWVTQA